MPLIAPILDDRSFEQIRSDLVNRIPVFNPEWTDYNRSDPAITLLELFAYLGEGLQFRFNQIPEATQLAFLQLLGQPLQPAQPASALLRCTTSYAGGVQLFAGDQAKAGKVLFTVENDAQIWPLDCVSVARQPETMPDASSEPELHTAVQATIDAVAAADATVDNIITYSTQVLAADASTPPVDFSSTVDGCVWIAVLKDPTLTLNLAPGSAPSLSLGFSPTPVTPSLQDITACPGTGVQTGPALEWRVSAAALSASGTPQYLPLRVAADSSAGFTVEGRVRLDLPSKLADLGVPVAPDGLDGTGDFPPQLDDARQAQVWFWLRVWRNDGSRIGSVSVICLNAVECTQAVTAVPELLGSGSGQPGQAFALANKPVIMDPLNPVSLQVEEAGIWTAWAQVDDLDASTADDRNFTVDAEAGTVYFGERFPQIGERVRVLSYRWGGGAAGNLPAQSIAKFGDLISGPTPPLPMLRPNQVDAKCGNPLPSAGGADGEAIADALTRIPGELRRRSRAVTSSDFSELAMMTPGVQLGRAECLPLFYAPDQSYPRPGVVSVVVWPENDALHPNAPLPDSYQLRQVCSWLDQHRLVTTELYVIPPTYHQIAIALAVKVSDGYGLDAVRDWVELLLRQYLAPLPPYGPDGAGWPLGRLVFGRELEGVAMQVEGVDYVVSLRLCGLDNGSWVEEDSVTLQQWEVVEVTAVTIVDDQTAVPDPTVGITPPATGTAVPIPVLRDDC